MTFGALWPWGIAGLAAIPLIVLIYVLQGLRQQRVVPSIYLWQAPAPEVTARARWRRPPFSKLFALQLAIAGVAALALAAPALSRAPRHYLIVILDASSSMRALDVSGAADGDASRFGESRRVALDLIGKSDAPTRVALIHAGATPAVVADTVDRGVLRQALVEMRPETGASAMREAIVRAGMLAAERPGDAAEIAVVSDGVFPPIRGLQVPAALRFLPVGRSGDNVAVATLSTRVAAGGSGTLQGLAQIVNTEFRPVDTQVQALVDLTPLEVRPVHLEARSVTAVDFTLPPQTRTFSIGLTSGDVLPQDDVAEVAVDANTHWRVTLVSETPETVGDALRAVSGIVLRVDTPRTFDGSPADLVVLDGFIPAALPRAPLLVVRPSADARFLDAQGQVDDVEVSQVDESLPLLEGVDVAAHRFSGASEAQPPAWASVVARSARAPLVLAGDLDGRRTVVLAFDPLRSHFDRAAAFPLLVANALHWTLQSSQPNDGDAWSRADITPTDHPELRAAAPSNRAGSGASTDIWPWLTVALLGLVAAEWWYFDRRG